MEKQLSKIFIKVMVGAWLLVTAVPMTTYAQGPSLSDVEKELSDTQRDILDIADVVLQIFLVVAFVFMIITFVTNVSNQKSGVLTFVGALVLYSLFLVIF